MNKEYTYCIVIDYELWNTLKEEEKQYFWNHHQKYKKYNCKIIENGVIRKPYISIKDLISLRKIIKEGKGECHYCKMNHSLFNNKYQKSENGRSILTIDHIIPISKTGETISSNLVLCCNLCNMFKLARTPEKIMSIAFKITQTMTNSKYIQIKDVHRKNWNENWLFGDISIKDTNIIMVKFNNDYSN